VKKKWRSQDNDEKSDDLQFLFQRTLNYKAFTFGGGNWWSGHIWAENCDILPKYGQYPPPKEVRTLNYKELKAAVPFNKTIIINYRYGYMIEMWGSEHYPNIIGGNLPIFDHIWSRKCPNMVKSFHQQGSYTVEQVSPKRKLLDNRRAFKRLKVKNTTILPFNSSIFSLDRLGVKKWRSTIRKSWVTSTSLNPLNIIKHHHIIEQTLLLISPGYTSSLKDLVKLKLSALLGE